MDAERALERRIVTVLFADLVGFTSLSESLDPEDIAAVQDAYFGVVNETVARYGGRLEKFIGDAAVAVFGIPRVRDDDAARAVRAGLALTSAVDQLGARLGLEGGELRLRVGINTGEVVYGEATAERGPVTGDTVNVAARLQTAARPGGVLVGEATALAVEDSVELENAGSLELKGKAAATRAWHAVRERAEPSRERAMGGLRAPILGRDEELKWLEAIVDAPPSPLRTVLLVAPPGVGKTRLVDELALRLRERAFVCRARLRPDVLAPYDGVAQLLLGALLAAGVPADRMDVETAARVLAERLTSAGATPGRAAAVNEAVLPVVWPPGTGERSAEPAEREVVFSAWLEAFAALASGQTAVWIVEDAHWAGGDLLAFLTAAGASPSHGPGVVLVTARPALRQRVVPGETFGLVEELEPLSQQDASTLIRALVGGALPDALLEQVAAASDGNPLFVEELLRAWISSGLLIRSGSDWQLSADPADVAVPTTVQTIYAAQLDDLPAGARVGARHASVPGRRFPVDSLEPLGVPAADEAVDVLTRRALVAGPDADAVFGSTYAFRHALLRDAGYASLARADRAELHVRFARWLEAIAAERRGQLAEIIGRHYAAALENAPRLAAEVAAGVSRAEAAEAAAAWLELGARHALELSAHDAARSLLARALELTADDKPVELARRRRKLGEAVAVSADMDEAAAELERAREAAASALASADAEERRLLRCEYAAVTATLGWVYNQQVRFGDAQRLAEDALAELGESDDAETARLLLLRGTAVGYGTDEVDAPLADVRRAVTVARAAESREVELEALLMQMRWEADIGVATVDDVRRVQRLALEQGRWATAVSALRVEAMVLLERDAASAACALDAAEELARSRGLLEELAWTDYTRAEHGLLIGEWDTALEAGLRAAELAERNGYRRAGIRSWYAVLPIAAARGEEDVLRQGHAFSERFRLHFPPVPTPWARIMSTAADLRFAALGLPRTARYEPDDEATLPAFDDASQLPSWCEAVEVVVRAWLDVGLAERARRALELAARAVDQATVRPITWPAVVSLLRARVDLAADAASAVEVSALENAAESLRQVPAPAWLARMLRLLEELGAATPQQIGEAAAVERDLGIR